MGRHQGRSTPQVQWYCRTGEPQYEGDPPGGDAHGGAEIPVSLAAVAVASGHPGNPSPFAMPSRAINAGAAFPSTRRDRYLRLQAHAKSSPAITAAADPSSGPRSARFGRTSSRSGRCPRRIHPAARRHPATRDLRRRRTRDPNPGVRRSLRPRPLRVAAKRKGGKVRGAGEPAGHAHDGDRLSGRDFLSSSALMSAGRFP